MADRPLDDRQKRFVAHYQADPKGNATQAAIKAGYAVSGARVTASRLLARGNIRAAVAASQAAQIDRIQVDGDWVLEQLVENVRRAMQAVEVLGPFGTPTGVYAYEGSVANKALELLARHFGLLKDSLDVTVLRREIDSIAAGLDLPPEELAVVLAEVESILKDGA